MSPNDLLEQIRRFLSEDEGRIRHVASMSGIPYDTVLRIKNGEGDPGYSKVKALASYYGIQTVRRPRRRLMDH